MLVLKYYKLYQLARALRLLLVPSFRKLFFKARRSDICFDFGANIGDASLVLWLRGCTKIYAFEPHPWAFKSLYSTTKHLSSITVINCAISPADGVSKLYLNSNLSSQSLNSDYVAYSQSSSILASKTNISRDLYVEVPSSSVVSILQSYGIPNLVKCDIEGCEYLIYKDLAALSTLVPVRSILIECHSNKYKQWSGHHNDMIKFMHTNADMTKLCLDWH